MCDYNKAKKGVFWALTNLYKIIQQFFQNFLFHIMLYLIDMNVIS